MREREGEGARGGERERGRGWEGVRERQRERERDGVGGGEVEKGKQSKAKQSNTKQGACTTTCIFLPLSESGSSRVARCRTRHTKARQNAPLSTPICPTVPILLRIKTH